MLRDAECMGRPSNNNVKNVVEVRGVDDLEDASVALRERESLWFAGLREQGSWVTLNALSQQNGPRRPHKSDEIFEKWESL